MRATKGDVLSSPSVIGFSGSRPANFIVLQSGELELHTLVVAVLDAPKYHVDNPFAPPVGKRVALLTELRSVPRDRFAPETEGRATIQEMENIDELLMLLFGL